MPKKPSKAGDTRVITQLEQNSTGRFVAIFECDQSLFSVSAHGSKLDDSKETATIPASWLPEKNRSAAFETDKQSDQQDDGCDQDQSDQSPGEIDSRLTSNGKLAYRAQKRLCDLGATKSSNGSSVLAASGFSSEAERSWDAEDGTRALMGADTPSRISWTFTVWTSQTYAAWERC